MLLDHTPGFRPLKHTAHLATPPTSISSQKRLPDFLVASTLSRQRKHRDFKGRYSRAAPRMTGYHCSLGKPMPMLYQFQYLITNGYRDRPRETIQYPVRRCPRSLARLFQDEIRMT
jgi:hypothetical protein